VGLAGVLVLTGTRNSQSCRIAGRVA